MTIIISHDQSSIDPSGECSDSEFPAIKAALECAYESAIGAKYPDAEIEFRGVWNPSGTRILDTDSDPSDILSDIDAITGEVFELGYFWPSDMSTD